MSDATTTDPADEVRRRPSARRKRTTEKVSPVSRRPNWRVADPDQDRPEADGPRGRRLLGLPVWGWPLAVLVFIAVILIVFDVRNRSRFRIRCVGDHVSLQQGKRLMWPFGFETIGGPFRPLALPADADCRGQVFANRVEAETAFLDLVLTEIRRTQLNNPGAKTLKQLRAMALQALRITRDSPHRVRRKEAERALAEVAYRQGRAGLARVEAELRTSLSHLQEARKRGGDHYEDLDDWIDHLESLLRTVAPTPGAGTPSGPLPLRPPTPFSGRPAPPPSSQPSAGGAATRPVSPVDGGGTDAGVELPTSSGGILM